MQACICWLPQILTCEGALVVVAVLFLRSFAAAFCLMCAICSRRRSKFIFQACWLWLPHIFNHLGLEKNDPKYLIRDFPYLFFWSIFFISLLSFFLSEKINLHVSSLSSTHLNFTHEWRGTIHIINRHVSAQTLNFGLTRWNVGRLPTTKATLVLHKWYLNFHSMSLKLGYDLLV